jgi:hypothetical protein
MKTILSLLIGSLSLACLAAPAAAANCDRECLRGMISSYLNALVKHDTSKLPLANTVRITEDSIEKPIEDVRLVRSVTKIRAYRQDFLDEREGVAGSDVIVEESGAPVLLVLRIKVADEEITEIESVATRSRTEGAIFNIDALERPSEIMSYVPRLDQLASRSEAIEMALRYPAGLQAGSFVAVDAPFAADAYRFENGEVMAGPNCLRNEACKNMKTQPLGTGVRGEVATRVAAVDERLGIVWLRMAWNRGTDQKLAVWESFKIYDGQIHAVEAFMKVLPADLGSGWD